MIYDLQKANIWKRISAWLFDLILFGIAVVGAAFVLSAVLQYDSYTQQIQKTYEEYETRYGITLDITAEEYEKLTAEQTALYEQALKELSADEEFNYHYTMLIQLTLLITTFGILLGFLLLEFLVPLLFGNGQTLGKKIFGIAVMRIDGVKLTPLQLFVRTVLGKYTVETMIPVMLILMIYFNFIGITGAFAVLILLAAQVILVLATKTHTALHDKLAGTVTVDLAGQMIFDSPDALMEYKKKIHEEQVNQTPS